MNPYTIADIAVSKPPYVGALAQVNLVKNIKKEQLNIGQDFHKIQPHN